MAMVKTDCVEKFSLIVVSDKKCIEERPMGLANMLKMRSGPI